MNEPEELFDSFQKESKKLFMLPYRKRIKLLVIALCFEIGFLFLVAFYVPSLSMFIFGCGMVTIIILCYNFFLLFQKTKEFMNAKPYMQEAFTDKLDQVQKLYENESK